MTSLINFNTIVIALLLFNLAATITLASLIHKMWKSFVNPEPNRYY